jgi:hypothetical protein
MLIKGIRKPRKIRIILTIFLAILLTLAVYSFLILIVHSNEAITYHSHVITYATTSDLSNLRSEGATNITIIEAMPVNSTTQTTFLISYNYSGVTDNVQDIPLQYQPYTSISYNNWLYTAREGKWFMIGFSPLLLGALFLFAGGFFTDIFEYT